MTYRHHGLMSMVLFSIMVIVAMVVVARTSLLAAAGFVGVNLLSTLGVAYCYCAKCRCRPHRCSHFIIGKVADYLPKRRQGPYTLGDYLGMMAAAGIVFAYPLYWLWSKPLWLIAFLGLGLLGMLEITLAVCPHCGNTNCPSARWPAKLRKTEPNLPSEPPVDAG